MLTLAAIDASARAARSYSELAAALRAQGVHSYTVDVASHATLYRSMTGELLTTPPHPERLPVAAVFSADATRAAIRRHQQGGSDYAGFLQDIAAAGVRRYEAVLAGAQPRCVYFGAEEQLEEPVPLPPLDSERTLQVRIARDWRSVAAFLAAPLNFNDWAAGLGHSLREEDGRFVGDGPAGPIAVRFSPPNAHGIADHWVEVAPGREVYVPLRTVAAGDGALVMLTLFRQPEMDAAAWAADLAFVEKDLAALRQLLESRP